MEPMKLAGALLVAGALSFFLGAGMPVQRAWFAADLDEYLAVVRTHPAAWTVCHVAMTVAAVVTAAGIGLLAWILAQPLAIAAAFAYAAGAAVFCVFEMYRLGVQGYVARLDTGTPDWFLGFEQLSGRLFMVFMLTAYWSLAAAGLAIVPSSVLPSWSGWTVFGFSIVAAVSLGTGQPRVMGSSPFEPPFIAFLPTLMIGVLLLLHA
jgi:hypothetical protein